MSIKTTHAVTREFAIAAIDRLIHNGDDLTNEQLENMLKEAIHNGFYNFSIVGSVEIAELEQGEEDRPYLNNIDNLPEYNDVY